MKELAVELDGGESLVIYRPGMSSAEVAGVKNQLRQLRIRRRKGGLDDRAGRLAVREGSESDLVRNE